MKKHLKQVWKLWAMPVLLAVLILLGLLAALLATGIWHVLSWCAMAIPLLIVWMFTVSQRGLHRI